MQTTRADFWQQLSTISSGALEQEDHYEHGWLGKENVTKVIN